MRGRLWRDPCVLGIDLGTSSTKAVLLDATGAELGSASVPVQLSRPRPGWVESDPEDWWLSVKTAVAMVLATRQVEVGAIGLSGQMHGVVLARSDGTSVRPAILWLDRRAEESLGAYRGSCSTYPRGTRQPSHTGDGRTNAPLAVLTRAIRPARCRVGASTERLVAPAPYRSRWQRTE